MTKESYFLLFISIGVFPAALGYGLNPKEFLPVLYGIEVLKKIKNNDKSDYVLRPDFINSFKLLIN